MASDTGRSRVYLRAVGTLLSPQMVDGGAVRLGGGLTWGYPIEIVIRQDGKTQSRVLVQSDGLDDAIATLVDELRESAERQRANLQRQHGHLTLGERTIRLDQPHVMAILNATPDSFSDGGRFDDDPQAAVDAGMQMLEAGAALIDIGGESTRPGAPSVWEGDEIKRVVPIIENLSQTGAAISIDTRKASVMEAALAAGAHMVNDISALLHDDRAIDVVAKSNCPVVLMHAPSSGADPHLGADYDHCLFDVFDWLDDRIEAVVAHGVERSRILVDPGIGFGKSLADNLALINGLPLFHALGQPLLFGASRKRMIGALSKEEQADNRLAGSLALALRAMDSGAHLLRVHDVADTCQALNVWRGLRDAALTDFSTLVM